MRSILDLSSNAPASYELSFNSMLEDSEERIECLGNLYTTLHSVLQGSMDEPEEDPWSQFITYGKQPDHRVSEEEYEVHRVMGVFRSFCAIEATHCVAALIDLGFDPNLAHKDYGTGLQIACARGNSQLAKHLVEAGAETDTSVAVGGVGGPLALACCLGHEDTTRYLLAQGAEVDMPCKRNRTPLLYAAARYCPCSSFDGRGDPSVLKKLLSIINTLLSHGSDWRLDCTARESQKVLPSDIMLDIIQHADANLSSLVLSDTRDLKGALAMAAERPDYEELLEALIRSCSDPNDMHPRVGSAVEKLVTKKDPWLWKLLLDSGADPSYQVDGRRACLALHIATLDDNVEDVGLLIRHGADGNAAAAKDEALRLPRGVKVNDFPSTVAAKFGYLDAVLLLQEHGAKGHSSAQDGSICSYPGTPPSSIDITDANGRSLIQEATRHESVIVARLLLEHRPSQQSVLDAIDEAIRKSNWVLIDLLQGELPVQSQERLQRREGSPALETISNPRDYVHCM